MGRPRKARRDLPERVYFEDGVYRYRPKGQPAALLGKDLSEALIAYGRLQAVKVVLATLGDCMDRYLAEVVPTKAPRTQLALRNITIARAAKLGWDRMGRRGESLHDYG